MKKFGTLVTMILLVSLLCSCNGQRKTEDNARPVTDVDPGMNPLLRLDNDTIQLGDSLTGIIGAVFEPSITAKQRELLITTISYRIDTTDADLTGDEIFYQTKKLNDSTFRFAILPNKDNDIDLVLNSSFYASIKC